LLTCTFISLISSGSGEPDLFGLLFVSFIFCIFIQLQFLAIFKNSPTTPGHTVICHFKATSPMTKSVFTIILPLTIFLISCGHTQSTKQNQQTDNAESPVADYGYNKLTLKTGKGTGSVEIADFNKDGKPDIVVANTADNSASVFLNEGANKFSLATGSTFPVDSFPNDIAIADFNNDNIPDLAIANNETKHLSVLLGKGKGGFDFSPYSPFRLNVKPHTHSVAAADFNNDGNIDLLTESWGVDSVLIIFGNGRGDFNLPRYFKVGKRPYQRVRTADLNHDTFSDIITTNLEGNNCSVLLCDGKGNFTEANGSPFSCGNAPFGVAVGDVNGDGYTDIAIADAPTITAESKGKDGLFILSGDGKGNFSPLKGSPFTTGKSPGRVATGDIDGNGIADIAVTNYNGKSISVFFMTKNGAMPGKIIQVGNHPDGIAIGDLNADGKGDIVVGNFDDNTINILLSK
jgi:FG-GAP-like repeat